MTDRRIRKVGLWIVAALLISSCGYPTPDCSEWDLTTERLDSLRFLAEHHYTTNCNFLVTADSLCLCSEPGGMDSLFVREGDRIVVADFCTFVVDTAQVAWIKVAHDQETMGWLSETELLAGSVPADPISRFIRFFGSVRTVALVSIAVCLLLRFLYERIRRSRFSFARCLEAGGPYPLWLCMAVACSAVLYASIQRFAPELWQHYYFYPTLNPFGLPCLLGCFLFSVWAVFIVGLATVDDVLRRLPFSAAFFHLLATVAACLFCYLFFVCATLYYIGYPCFAAFLFFVCRFLWRMHRRLLCGCCGREIVEPGICPHCGTYNV